MPRVQPCEHGGRARRIGAGQNRGAVVHRQPFDDRLELLVVQALDGARRVEGEDVPARRRGMQVLPGDHLVLEPDGDAPEPEPPQERRAADLDRDEHQALVAAGEQHVADPGEAPAPQVDDLRVEHVPAQMQRPRGRIVDRPAVDQTHAVRRFPDRSAGPPAAAAAESHLRGDDRRPGARELDRELGQRPQVRAGRVPHPATDPGAQLHVCGRVLPVSPARHRASMAWRWPSRGPPREAAGREAVSA